MKRFGEVVVGTEREPRDGLGGRTGGGQHQDHRRVVVGNHPAEDVAVHDGESTIQDNHLLAKPRVRVWRSRSISPPGPIDGGGAEADDLDGVARLAQFDRLGLSPQQQA